MVYKNSTVERMIEEHKECLAVTMPGAYALIYFNEQDEVLCSDCATKDAVNIIEFRTYDEGPSIRCCSCNKEIESSYGVPEVDK